MLKIFSILAAALAGRRAGDRASGDGDWRCDPLAHPALRAMSPKELGDLPWRATAGAISFSCN